MRFTTTYFALAISLTGVNADILSFSGNQCNGNRGSEVKCDNSCHSFSGRSSFKVGTYPFINIHKHKLEPLFSFRLQFPALAVSRSMRTLIANSKSTGSAMMDLAHAALSTPAAAHLLWPTHAALTRFACNRRPRTRSCWWRGSIVLSMLNLLPYLKS